MIKRNTIKQLESPYSQSRGFGKRSLWIYSVVQKAGSAHIFAFIFETGCQLFCCSRTFSKCE